MSVEVERIFVSVDPVETIVSLPEHAARGTVCTEAIVESAITQRTLPRRHSEARPGRDE